MKKLSFTLSLMFMLLPGCKEDSVTEPEGLVVNYFPLKVGNRWEYESLVWDCETDYYSNKFEGTEIWEISSVNIDGKRFSLDRYFTGTKKRLFQLNQILETTYYQNKKTSFSLIYNHGIITSSDGSGEVPLGFRRVKLFQPYTENGIYNYNFKEGDETTSYTLEIGKGITEYDYYDNRAWANEYTQEKLSLKNFTEGE